jgi:peptide-methionine (S)-S-oxide reductase
MSTSVPPSQIATFAAGCFWGVEHIFLKHWPIEESKGILKSSVGYTCGHITPQMSTSIPPSQIARCAPGCFWGVEHILLKHWPIKESKGILKSSVGYTGGSTDAANPTYHEVCSGCTSHAEAVMIEFDPDKVTYDELVGASVYSCSVTMISLTLYHLQSISIARMIPRLSIPKAQIAAPVSSNTLPPHSSLIYLIYVEYRSAIFFHTAEQEAIARRVTQEVQEKYFTPKGRKIVTTIEAAGPWYEAEDHHQEYLFKNPTGYQCPTHRLHW